MIVYADGLCAIPDTLWYSFAKISFKSALSLISNNLNKLL